MSSASPLSHAQLPRTLQADKLFIDCQILQTAAYDRGMGKYTLNLLKALLRILPESMDVRLIFNNNLLSGNRIESIQHYINGGKAEFLDLPTSIDSSNYRQARSLAKSKITTFVSKESQGKKAYYLMTAPFFVGFPSVFPDGKNLITLAVVYDITPQKIWYLQKIFPDDLYFSHYEVLLEADHLVTISSAVKDDIVTLVGINDKKVTVIDGGPMLREDSDEDTFGWKDKQPYILDVTAPIAHKNNRRAVRGFARFNKREGNKYKLYIVSHFDQHEQEKLLRLSPDIVFTDSISDEELAHGYKNASAVLFSSLAEGLGMPVLEAAAGAIPVACSRIPVFEELSSTAFYLFNPLDVADIAKSLGAAVSKSNWDSRLKAIDELQKKYTWPRSAERFHGALIAAGKEKTNRGEPIRIVTPSINAKTPAAYIVNMLSVYLRDIGYDVTTVSSLDPKTGIPPFSSYIHRPSSTKQAKGDHTKTITIRNRRFNQGIVIDMPGRSLIFKASFVKDKALGYSSWCYDDVVSHSKQTAYQLARALGETL